jgi:hypothetical protein
METVQQITIEAKSLNMLFKHNNFRGQRLGQAFFNHFQLHKMKEHEQFNKLYQEKDEEKARQLIRELVIHH